MSLRKLIGKLRYWITGEPTYEQLITSLPYSQSNRELAELINKKIMQRNAELEAEVLKYKARDEEKRLEEQRRVEEEEIIEKVKKHNEEIEKLEKAKSIKLIFEGLKKPPTFFLRNNVPFYKLKGMYLKEDDEGYLYWYPILTDGKKDKIFKKPTTNFNDFFKEKIGLVSQIRGGKVDSNFDITKDGKPILITKDVVKDKEKEYKIIHLNEQEERKLLHEIEEWKKAYSGKLQEIEDLQKRITDLEIDSADKEVATNIATRESDIMKSTIAVLADKRPASTIAVANALASSQDTLINHLLSERLNMVYTDVIDSYREKLKEVLSKEELEVGEERIKSLIDSATERIKSDIKFSLPPISHIPVPSSVEVKK